MCPYVLIGNTQADYCCWLRTMKLNLCETYREQWVSPHSSGSISNTSFPVYRVRFIQALKRIKATYGWFDLRLSQGHNLIPHMRSLACGGTIVGLMARTYSQAQYPVHRSALMWAKHNTQRFVKIKADIFEYSCAFRWLSDYDIIPFGGKASGAEDSL